MDIYNCIYHFRCSPEEWMKTNPDQDIECNKNDVSLKFLNKLVNKKK